MSSIEKLKSLLKEVQSVVKDLELEIKTLEYQRNESIKEQSKQDDLFYYCKGNTEESFLNTPIEQTPLSNRIKNCFRAAEIVFVKDILQYNRYQLLQIRGFGKLVLKELELFLFSHGVKMK